MQNNPSVLPQTFSSPMNSPINPVRSCLIPSSVINYQVHCNGNNQFPNGYPIHHPGVQQPLTVQNGSSILPQMQQVTGNIVNFHQAPQAGGQVRCVVQTPPGMVNTNVFGTVSGVEMSHLPQVPGICQPMNAFNSQNPNIPMVMAGGGTSLQGGMSGTVGQNIGMLPNVQYQCNAPHRSTQNAFTTEMPTIQHPASIQQCQNVAFVYPQQVPGNLFVTENGQQAPLVPIDNQTVILTEQKQLQSPVHIPGDQYNHVERLSTENEISANAKQGHALDTTEKLVQPNDSIRNGNSAKVTSPEAKMKTAIIGEQQHALELATSRTTSVLKQTDPPIPSQHAPDHDENLRAPPSEEKQRRNASNASVSEIQEEPDRTEPTRTRERADSQDREHKKAPGVGDAQPEENEAKDPSAPLRSDTLRSQSLRSLSMSRLDGTDNGISEATHQTDSLETFTFPLAPSLRRSFSFFETPFSLRDDQIQTLNQPELSGDDAQRVSQSLRETTIALGQVWKFVTAILCSLRGDSKDSGVQGTSAEKHLLSRRDSMDEGFLQPPPEKETCILTNTVRPENSAAKNAVPPAVTTSLESTGASSPQSDLRARIAAKKDAKEAFLDYNWKKLSLAERRKRRVRICSYKRLPVSKRRIIKSTRKGEQPIDFRSLEHEEMVELGNAYPRMSIKKDKKTRNRMVAQNSRDQIKESMEFLEKENEVLRSKIAEFNSNQNSLRNVQVSGVSMEQSTVLIEKLTKLKTMVGSVLGDCANADGYQDALMSEAALPTPEQDEMEIKANE